MIGRFAVVTLFLFGPTVAYLYARLHPQLVPQSLQIAAGAQFVALLALAWNRLRPSKLAQDAGDAAKYSCLFLILALIYMPKLDWAVRLGHTERGQLERQRMILAERKAAKGALLTAEEVGKLPELEIWVTGDRGEDHYHKSTAQFSVVSGTSAIPDTGGWAYDPATGRLSLACSGLEPKMQRTRLREF